MANKQGGVGCYRSFLTHFQVLISRSPSVYHSLIHCQGSLSIFTVTRRSMLSGCRYAKSLIITIVVIDCVHFLSCLIVFSSRSSQATWLSFYCPGLYKC